MKKNFYLCFILIVVAIFGFFKTTKVVLAEDIRVTFDFNTERIENFLPNIITDKLQNINVTCKYGDKVSSPEIYQSVLRYYDYVWTVEGNEVQVDEYVISENVVFKIEWSPIEYNVIYNYLTNNELEEIKNLKMQDVYSIEKPIHYYKPSRPYYAFVDWYSSANFEGIPQLFTDKYTFGDKYLYAKWIPIEYNIDYNTDAYNVNNPSSYNFESPTYVLEDPEKEGHIFKGWFLDKNFAYQITEISQGSHGDLELYPKWELEEYLITYILPNGDKQILMTKYGETAPKPNISKSIFQVATYSTSLKNITDDTIIYVQLVNIWYVYLIALFIVAVLILCIILYKKNKSKNLHKLRYIYQSNLKNTKRKR